MIFASFLPFSPFSSKSQVPTHLTSLNHDMFSHSLSYLISCPFFFILSLNLSSVISVKKAITVFGEAPPFSIEALRAEVDDLLAWSDQLCVELDTKAAHQYLEVEHLVSANQELSVQFNLLQAKCYCAGRFPTIRDSQLNSIHSLSPYLILSKFT